MSFKKWLKTFKDVDHAIGDLAKDVADDKSFPSKISSMKDLVSYLHSRNADPLAVIAATNAYVFYALDENLASIENGELVWKGND